MGLKKVTKRLILGKRADSDSYIKYLRNLGVEIGDDTIIYVPQKTEIDIQNPWMIKIGDNVKITQGVVILTHDYSWSVLKRNPRKEKQGQILGAIGPVTIGNNVFIGINSVITRNVTIGDNIIIGTGSIVTKDCLEPGVYAGNPAKKIMSLDAFCEKREKAQLSEAKELAVRYFEKYKKLPPKEIFREYFMLFEDEDSVRESKLFSSYLELCQNYDESIRFMKINKRRFESYEAFLKYCLKI